MYVNKTEIYKIKVHNKIRWYEFYLGNLSKGFTKNEQSKIFLNGSVYDFLLDHNAIEKTYISIHKYLMVKNNIN